MTKKRAFFNFQHAFHALTFFAAVASWLIVSSAANAEIITADRRVPWQGNVGVAGGIPNSFNKTVYTTIPAGASAATVDSALGNCPANQVVVLSAGTYNWSTVIDWQGVNSGVVLRGAGANSTRIVFSNFATDRGIAMRGTSVSEAALSQEASLTANAVKGNTTVTLASVPSWVTVGKFIGIDQLDEPSFVSGTGTEGGSSYRDITGNGDRGLGMLNRVVAKTATTITFELPLNYGYKVSQSAQIFQPIYNPSTASPLVGCGIEDLTIECTFTQGSSRVIVMELTDSCYLKNVTILNAADIPVFASFSYRCEIRGCDMRGTRSVGSGQGYSVALYHICTGFLVEDNIFQGFHNNMTCNYGATCNVFAYNYEKDGTSTSGQNPGMNTHGTHTYMNLWEGNYCEDKLLADWTHGSSSHNTAFRNRITGENGSGDSRTCISIEYYNRYWNVVGNVLGVDGLQNKLLSHSGSTGSGTLGSILKIGGEVNINNDFSPSDAASYTTGSFVLIHGNWDFAQDIVTYEPAVADHALPNSYYLASKPTWFGDRPWPPFDPASPATAVVTNLPAGYRFVFGVNPPTGPVNQSPVAVATAAPKSGVAPLPVVFSSVGSFDPEGTALSYSWNFGDGGTSAAANPSRTYAADGTFVARLTVSDGTNTTMSTNITITVGNQAPVSVCNATPSAGTPPLVVAFSSAGSSDPEGATLTYSWNFGDGSPVSTVANPSHTYAAVGSYVARLTVSDGTKSTVSADLPIIVSNFLPGLVAAYGFEAGSGTVLADLSGSGNSGTINGATWTTSGKYGKALSFNGTSSLVTINDSPSLGLTSGMTLEAWVFPTAVGGWRDVVFKADDIYFLMGSSTTASAPATGGTFGSATLFGSSALPLNQWTHLAGTYDGATMRLYINGVQVGSRAQTGNIQTSTQPLTIGGDTVSGQFWAGMIDEVRVYNRALSLSEIQADMSAPVEFTLLPAPPTNLRIMAP